MEPALAATRKELLFQKIPVVLRERMQEVERLIAQNDRLIGEIDKELDEDGMIKSKNASVERDLRVKIQNLDGNLTKITTIYEECSNL